MYRENCEQNKYGASCFSLGVAYFVGAGVKQDAGEGCASSTMSLSGL